MGTTAAITPVRTGFRVEFGTKEMLAACATMATAAEYPDLIDKIAFF